MLDGGPGYEIDLDAVHSNVDEADVVSVYFPMLRKTLIVDTRVCEDAGPLVQVVDMVQNASERFRSLRRLRPQFPRPESITLIPWVMRVSSLRQTGVWGHLTARLSDSGAEILDDAASCFDELATLERREMWQALNGSEYHTIWRRDGAQTGND
ncbi:MAG TPA: hypothetical protein QF624_10765 [Dehalococcoidia bacterium]|nr:hypothetical protein [Dehalococcoidia bacterium]